MRYSTGEGGNRRGEVSKLDREAPVSQVGMEKFQCSAFYAYMVFKGGQQDPGVRVKEVGLSRAVRSKSTRITGLPESAARNK